jgi:hypothetical protein
VAFIHGTGGNDEAYHVVETIARIKSDFGKSAYVNSVMKGDMINGICEIKTVK